MGGYGTQVFGAVTRAGIFVLDAVGLRDEIWEVGMLVLRWMMSVGELVGDGTGLRREIVEVVMLALRVFLRVWFAIMGRNPNRRTL